MSNVALITYDTSNNTYTYTYNLLSTYLGHTVTVFQQADVPTSDFTSYDLIVTVRTYGSGGASVQKIVDAVDAGVPIICGYDLSSGTTNILPYELGLIDNVSYLTTSVNSLLQDKYVENYFARNVGNIFKFQIWLHYLGTYESYFNISTDNIASSAEVLTVNEYDNNKAIFILAPSGGANLNAGSFGANVCMLGQLAGVNSTSSSYDFTPDFKDWFGELVSLMIGGFYKISGTVKDSSLTLCARNVELYEEETGMLSGNVTSDGTTGVYSFNFLNGSKKYTVVCYDEVTRDEQALVFDNITPVSM